MRVIFTWKEILVIDGENTIATIPASCRVRNELNGQRHKHEVVYTYPKSGHPKPYYPRQYPSGIFNITGIEFTDDPEYAPVKIRTDATRDVFTWDLDVDGNYWKISGRIQIDTCYWLHYTKSSTTLGCIRIGSDKDALKLANILEPRLEAGELIKLEVL